MSEGSEGPLKQVFLQQEWDTGPPARVPPLYLLSLKPHFPLACLPYTTPTARSQRGSFIPELSRSHIRTFSVQWAKVVQEKECQWKAETPGAAFKQQLSGKEQLGKRYCFIHLNLYKVKLSPGVCQVSSDSLKVRGHASPGPVPVGSPISQNRLGRWDGQ
ncbi:hypothetical protein Q8A67_019225 [Cirrhinus molitorella]|uniref:Uncharacterized protein n=1 Tax=Cirrhinus molitorella TaxID=172907 RepID=A0AA88PDL1_9TELE|nr:hypothetical protein Q8A67_019225 [Cirrhinus molitorella]